MFKAGIKMMLVVALATAPIAFVPSTAHAQNDAEHRAYQAGYNNGVNDRNQNKPLNLKTDNWHGQNLQSYERGYQDGYRNAGRGAGYHGDEHQGWGHDNNNLGNAQTDPERRAYEAGYNNGTNDRSQNKPLNLKTDNWHGQNLNFYRQGYQDGYNGRGQHGHNHDDHHDHDHDRDDH